MTPITPSPRATPALSALRVSPGAFAVSGRRVAGHCQPLTHHNRKHPHCKRAIALNISYKLNVAASVEIAIEHVLAGRLVGGRCVAITNANRDRHSCTRSAQAARTLTQTGSAGDDNLLFSGQIGGRQLSPGSYQLTATPIASGSTGAPQTATFSLK